MDGPLSGKLVIEAKGVSKAFDGKTVVDKFSIRIHRGDRVGMAGPNGAGKTTLLNMLIGKLEPDEGAVRLGANLEIASLEQSRDSLKPDWTVADALTGGSGDLVVINGAARHVASYMQDFLFQPEQVRTPVKVLSGGERARLMLARALASRRISSFSTSPPTTSISKRSTCSKRCFRIIPVTLVLISHDRDFLDRIAMSIIVPEGSGRWIEYAGGYTDMVAQKGGRAFAAEAPVKAAKAFAEAANKRADSGDEPKAKKRLSFKEKHALETLPARMASLEKEIASLQAKLWELHALRQRPRSVRASERRPCQGARRIGRSGTPLAGA